MTGMAVRLLMWASIVGIGCDAISSRPAGALELRLLTESSSTVVGHSPSWPIYGMLTTRGWGKCIDAFCCPPSKLSICIVVGPRDWISSPWAWGLVGDHSILLSTSILSVHAPFTLLCTGATEVATWLKLTKGEGVGRGCSIDVPRRGRGACSTGTHCFPAGPPLLLCRFERWVPGRLGSLNWSTSGPPRVAFLFFYTFSHPFLLYFGVCRDSPLE